MKNKFTVSDALHLYSRQFFREAYVDNGQRYEDMDDWDSFTLEDGRVLDINAYHYGDFMGVTAYAVTDDGIDTDSAQVVFRWCVGENPDDRN